MRNFQIETQVGGASPGGRCSLPVVLSDHIAAGGFVMDFARNEEIFGEAEPADFIYRVVSGTVRSVRFLNDGRRQIETFFSAGDVFGLEDGPAHSLSAEAVVDCRVALVRRAAVEREAGRDFSVARDLWSLAASDVRRMREHMLLLGRKGAVERVAAFLLELAGRAGSRGPLELPMSRTDIADYLGLTIETVSRTVTQLEREGLIALEGARRISLLDRDGLTERAC